MKKNREDWECPTCHHIHHKFKVSFDSANMSTLLKIWNAIIEEGKNEVHVGSIGLTYTERSRMTHLRLHGMIHKITKADGSHKRGFWLMTRKGCQFVKGEIKTPKHIWIMNNEKIGVEEELVDRSDFRVMKEFTPNYEWEIIDGHVLRKVERQTTLFSEINRVKSIV